MAKPRGLISGTVCNSLRDEIGDSGCTAASRCAVGAHVAERGKDSGCTAASRCTVGAHAAERGKDSGCTAASRCTVSGHAAERGH
ncbi:hypothetical protein D3C84_91890 [compost metagenome]